MNQRALRAHVLDLVRRVVAYRKLDGRPPAEDVLAALDLPAVRRASLQNGADGMRAGRQILISDGLTSPERIEFTIFHEILHILIDEDGEVVSQLHEHFYHRADDERERVMEDLCNIGAAEFMMPGDDFARVMEAEHWRVAGVALAVVQFRASAIACAFQFAQRNPDRCIVVVCEHGVPRRRTGGQPLLDVSGGRECLHVAYTAYHPEEEYRMCRFVPVPTGHLIHQVWRDGADSEGEAPGFFATSKQWRIRCDVTRIGGRAYAVYYTKGRRYQPGQGSLFG